MDMIANLSLKYIGVQPCTDWCTSLPAVFVIPGIEGPVMSMSSKPTV